MDEFWPQQSPPASRSPTDGTRVWLSQVGHLIQDVACDECLGHLPSLD